MGLRWKRWLGAIVIIFSGALLLAMLFHPWLILQVVLRIAADRGILVGAATIDDYESYTLRNIRFQWDTGTVTIESLSVRQPFSWFRSVAVRNDLDAKIVHAEGWTLTTTRQQDDQSDAPASEANMSELFAQAERFEPIVRKWVPRAAFHDGTVQFPENQTIRVSEASWHRGNASIHAHLPDQNLSAAIEGTIEGPWHAIVDGEASSEPAELTVYPEAHRDAVRFVWELEWLSASGWGELEFGRGDRPFIPEAALCRIDVGKFEGEQIGIPQLSMSGGNLDVDWDGEKYAFAANVVGRWSEEDRVIPIVMNIMGDGDFEYLQLHELNGETPWIYAQLNSGTAWDFAEVRFTEPFVFEFEVNFDAINLDDVTGLARGSLTATMSLLDGYRTPVTEFEGVLSGVQIRDIPIDALMIRGRQSNADLHVEALKVEGLNGDIMLSAIGEVDFEPFSFAGVEFSASFEESALATILPDASFITGPLQISGALEGTIDALEHRGSVTAESIALPNLYPFAAHGTWAGKALETLHWNLEGEQESALIRLAGSITREDDAVAFSISELDLIESGSVLIMLQERADARWIQAEDGSWSFDIAKLAWSGEGGQRGAVSASWRAAKPHHFAVEVSNLELKRFQAITPIRLPDLDLSHVLADFDQSSGEPAGWNLILNSSLTGDPLPAGEQVWLGGEIAAGASGITVQRLHLSGVDEPFVFASGKAPLALHWEADGPRIRVIPESESDLWVRIDSRPTLLRLVREYFTYDIGEPTLELHITGPPSRPTGHFALALDSFSPAGFQLGGEPLLFEDLEVHVDLTPKNLVLERAQVHYGSEVLSLTGSIPMRIEDWLALWEDRKIPDWSRAALQLRTDRFRIESLSSFLPDVLLPNGSFSAALNLHPGPRFTGFVELEGVSTRPLPTGIAVREISGRVAFDDTRATIQQLTADLERHPVSITGFVDFADWRDPAFELALHGENLPLLRQPELIVRGDADVHLSRKSGMPGILHGNIILHHSLLMRDFRTIARPGAASANAAARPPFFNVEVPLLEDWRFNLSLRGDEFMRVQIPFFSGKLSADFQLLGRFAQPFLVGEGMASGGVVSFPFGNIRLSEAEVRLTRSDPYNPEIHARGTARTMGYDIQMEATGSVYDPVVRFHSNPPLSQDAILLLLTAGVIPGADDGPGAAAVGQRIAFFVGRGLARDLFASTEEGWTRNLSIEMGGRSSETGREIYRIEYRLSEDFSLVGENNEFDEYYGGIRWRFYSR